MAETLTGTIAVQIAMTLTNVIASGLVNPSAALALNKTLSFDTGVGAGQADRLYAPAQFSVAQSINTDIDLAGVLTDLLGQALTFVKVKAIYIECDAANPDGVTVGAGTNPFIAWLLATGDGVKIRPGGFLLLGATEATGFAVTAGTADILRIATPATAGTYLFKVVIVGTSS